MLNIQMLTNFYTRCVCASRTPGFLGMCVYVCVSPPLRLLITSGMMWCDIWSPYDWLNKFYSFYMVAVVVINDGRGLTQQNLTNLMIGQPPAFLAVGVRHTNFTLGNYSSNMVIHN